MKKNNLTFIIKYFFIILFFSSILSSTACNSCKKLDDKKKFHIDKDALVVSIKKEKYSPFEKSLIQKGLVDINSIDPAIIVDLKYSSDDNFLGEDVYGNLNRCFLQKAVAIKLCNAQKILKEFYPGYNFIIFDCVRPRSVQYKMWEIVKGTKKQIYVANPDKGSIHSYGAAVDLSIVDKNNQELDMGTIFDYFGPLAQPRYEEKFLREGKLTLIQIKNRKLLRKIMKDASFYGILSEWWHFNGFSPSQVRRMYKMVD